MARLHKENTDIKAEFKRLLRAAAKLEESCEVAKTKFANRPEKQPTQISEKRIEKLEARIRELQEENDSLKRKLEKQEPYFETVRNISQPQPQSFKAKNGGNTLKDLFEDGE